MCVNKQTYAVLWKADTHEKANVRITHFITVSNLNASVLCLVSAYLPSRT